MTQAHRACALALAAVAAGAVPALVRADSVALASPPAGAVLLEARAGHAFTGRAGDPDAPAPTWHVAQWKIPDELSPAAGKPGEDWRIANDFGEVAWTKATGTYELGADGRPAGLPCSDELDLFLEPNGPSQARAPSGVQPSAPLSALRSVHLHFGYRLGTQAVTTRCGINYASSIVAVVLDAPSRHQTLFYQVVLVDSRGGKRGPDLRRAWCPGNPTQQFCIDTSVAAFGAPVPAPGAARAVYDVDLRDELVDLVRAGHGALDRDPADWHISSLYFGDIVLGGAATTTQWDGFTLTTGE